MTDLPAIKATRVLEPETCVLALLHATSSKIFRNATLEDVRQVLDAAGYVVLEKRPYPKPGEKFEYDAPPPSIPSPTGNPTSGGYVFLRDGEYWYRTSDGREFPAAINKTSGSPGGDLLGSLTKEISAPRPAGGREEPGTVVPEFGEDRRALLVATPGKSGIRRATFADLHEVEKKHWISLTPCSECEYGPVNDKICTTCFEFVEGRMRDLALAVREGLAKRDWGTVKKGMLEFDGIKIGGITIEDEGSTIGAAKLHEQVRDLAAKVVALDKITDAAIGSLLQVGQRDTAAMLKKKVDALK